MEIDQLNLNNLRVFQSVYQNRCMTKASKQLHLTQSGVSQHIKSLEESLGVSLFDRISKKIIPTEAGEKLYSVAHEALSKIESALINITQKEVNIKGPVNIGLPIEFGNNIILPLLSKMGRENPGLMFNITMDFAAIMNEKLLKGELDFAVVDEYQMDERIVVSKIAEEYLELVASKEFLKPFGDDKESKAYFEDLEYVDYQPGEPVLRSWFSHHLKRKNLIINVRAHVMDVQGVARFVLNHLGAGILPDHLVKRLQDNGHKLHVFKGCGKPLKNTMSIAYLKERSRPRATDFVLTELPKLIQG